MDFGWISPHIAVSDYLQVSMDILFEVGRTQASMGLHMRKPIMWHVRGYTAIPNSNSSSGSIKSSHVPHRTKRINSTQSPTPPETIATMAESQPSSELTDLLAQRAELQAKIDALQSADAPTKQQTVNPQNVSGEIGADGVAKAINYDKLIEEFGTKKILEGDLRRFEEVTGHKPHRFMRRGIVFSHRDLNLILDRHEKGEPFFLYTGRGPSSDSMHIGHTIPFDFTQ